MNAFARPARVFLLFAALAAVLVACGDDTTDDPVTVDPVVTSTVPVTEVPATPEATPPPTAEPTEEPTAEPTPILEEPPPGSGIPVPAPGQAEVSLLVVVDKERSLPHPYIPPGLAWIPGEWLIPGYGGLLARSDALEAYGAMQEAAQAEGIEFRIRSAYRSYEEQVTTFDYWIGYYGSEEEARRWSAEPGHSEHQLGTTLDIISADVGWELEQAFGDTPAGEWLEEHAADFGFALSYPRDGESTTGYAYEPWHFRYIGVSAAQAWRDSGLTLVEFLEQR